MVYNISDKTGSQWTYRQDELQQLRVVEVADGLPQISKSITIIQRHK